MFENRRGACICVAAITVAVFFSCASVPAPSVPASEDPAAIRQEIEVGKAALAKIAGRYGMFQDRDATSYLNLYLKSLSLYSKRQGLEFSAAILNTREVNAYALPGGYVLVTLGLLKQLDSPGELAGVLAHELGHIDARHILDNVKIQLSADFWETLARVIAGSRQVITTAMDQVNQKIEEKLFLEGYAADDEFEADAHAVLLLHSIGTSVQPYARLLEKLDRDNGSSDLEVLDRTHPPAGERLKAVRALSAPDLPELPPTGEFDRFMNIIRHAEAAR